MKYKLYKSGFTLLELTIILLIIGLISAVVIFGFTLSESAHSKRIISELNYFKQAIDRFQDQFNGWPGDLPRADELWGADCGGDAAASTGGCNGDGDRLIEWGDAEGVKGWQLLQLAEMIDSTIPLSGSITSDEAVIGTNVPASQITPIGYSLYSTGGINYLSLGGAVTNARNDAPVLTPNAARIMDERLDDGNPSTGLLVGRGASCIAAGEYNLAVRTSECSLDLALTR